jgi:hypothetical protein
MVVSSEAVTFVRGCSAAARETWERDYQSRVLEDVVKLEYFAKDETLKKYRQTWPAQTTKKTLQ